jgi:hypothetical protein
MRSLVRLAVAAATAAGLALTFSPAAQAAPAFLGEFDFRCDTATNIYNVTSDFEIVGNTVYVWGAVGDTFDLDEDSYADCNILSSSGGSVNDFAGLGGFVVEGAGGYDSFAYNPLRIIVNDTDRMEIRGAGIFLIEAANSSYYTVVVNGGVAAQAGGKEIWQQAVGRGSSDEACPEGYDPSWMLWPNDGQGGWVCVKNVYTYTPWLPVK